MNRTTRDQFSIGMLSLVWVLLFVLVSRMYNPRLNSLLDYKYTGRETKWTRVNFVSLDVVLLTYRLWMKSFRFTILKACGVFDGSSPPGMSREPSQAARSELRRLYSHARNPAGSSVCVLGYYTWNLDFLRKLSVLEVERLTIIHWIFDSISSLGCWSLHGAVKDA